MGLGDDYDEGGNLIPKWDNFDRLYNTYSADKELRDTMAALYRQASQEVASGGGFTEETKRRTMAAGAGTGADGKPAVTSTEQVFALKNIVGALDSGLQKQKDQLFEMSPPKYQGKGFTLTADNVRDGKLLWPQLFGGADTYRPPVQAYSFQKTSRGVLVMNSIDGSHEMKLLPPEMRDKNIEVIQSSDGHAYAIDKDNLDAPRIDLGQFKQPEIDPALKFKVETLTNAATVQAAFAGIELQQRGQVISAIAADMANQVAVGRMEIEEANVNLNRMNSALAAQRAEREQLLKYAVTAASLRPDGQGGMVTRLPFAEATANILSQATGTRIDPTMFDLPVAYANPNAAGQAVLDASAYNSPIPGLVAGFESARAAIGAMVGQKVGDSAVATQLTALGSGVK